MAHVCCRVLSRSVTNKQVCSSRNKQFSRVEFDYGEKIYFLTLQLAPPHTTMSTMAAYVCC